MVAFGCWWWLSVDSETSSVVFVGDKLTRRWVDSAVSCWAKRRPGILLGYVWAVDWWVLYLWQGKVHLQVLIMVGLLDMKMIKLDCIKSHQSVSIYYCLLYIQYASEFMTGIWKMRLRFDFACHMVSMSLQRAWRYRKFSIDSCYEKSCQIFAVLI